MCRKLWLVRSLWTQKSGNFYVSTVQIFRAPAFWAADFIGDGLYGKSSSSGCRLSFFFFFLYEFPVFVRLMRDYTASAENTHPRTEADNEEEPVKAEKMILFEEIDRWIVFLLDKIRDFWNRLDSSSSSFVTVASLVAGKHCFHSFFFFLSLFFSRLTRCCLIFCTELSNSLPLIWSYTSIFGA